MGWVRPFRAGPFWRLVYWAHDRLRGWSETLRFPGPLGRWALPLTPTVTVVAVLAGAVGAGAVWFPQSGQSGGWTRVGLGLAVTAALVIVAAALLLSAGLKMFGLLHLAYLGLTVAVPMVGVAVGVRTVTGAMAAGWAAVALGLIVPAAVGWYGTHVEPFYVSPGVGLERAQAPQLRLFCRPTIAILELVTPRQ